MADLIPRSAAARLSELATHLRIVMLGGPRQAGKTTLLRQYLSDRDGSYRTLDTASVRRAAADDPVAFVEYGSPPRIIDEVQLGGDDLVRAIKLSVDNDARPGRFILSGSSRFLAIPTLSESLAGRMGFVDLWGLSMAERTGARSDLLDRMFGDPDRMLADSDWGRRDYIEAVVAGGYPEAAVMPSIVARRAWYDGYLSTVINRDISNFAAVAHADAIARLLGLVAARAGSIAVISDLAQSVELARPTTKDYLSYLDMVYLVTRLPAWSSNATSRLVKSPKLYPTDSGLAAHLLGVDADDLTEPGHPSLGPLVETFVAGELFKAVASHDKPVRLSHARTQTKNEVDFILEGPGGRVVAVEVKASSSPGGNAVKGLRWLRERLGDKLHAGYLLHLGTEAGSRGDGIYTIPMSTLWNDVALGD